MRVPAERRCTLSLERLPRALRWAARVTAAYAALAAAGLAADAAPPPAAPPPPPPASVPPPPAGATGASPAAEDARPVKPADVEAEAEAERARATMQIVPEIVPVERPPTGLLLRALRICPPPRCLDPFLRDTDLRLHLRTFWFDRHNPDTSDNEAWAIGGWLQYESGWFQDVLQIGATGYTSQPLYAPEDRDGTSILAPGQEEITVLGQAWGRLRWKDYAVLTAYRQSVNDGYVGPQDNRMIPNAFEGVTLRGKVETVAYDVGYLWAMKPRNKDKFVDMSEQAGVADSDEGLWFGSLKWTPTKAWELFAGDYYTPEVFNTVFAQATWKRPLTACAEGNFGVQYTDQRSVGDERLGRFETWNLGLGARAIWEWGLTVGAAFHATGDDANIRSPYGTWPGWLSLIEVDFDRANEKALGAAVRYDFGKSRRPFHAPGLKAVLAYARGFDREDPSTGEGLDDTGELDFDVTYDVPTVKGLQLRLRNAYVDSGGPDTGYQLRLIANWEIDLL